ncbi:DUF3710 domain-containing protein [Nocardia brasiliensis]|nr:DUF3710 domain-containing protein [Nocardia brasiliensis]
MTSTCTAQRFAAHTRSPGDDTALCGAEALHDQTDSTWGDELVATMGDRALRFIGVDGPRWMLRAVILAPPATVRHGASALWDLVRSTVVVRGAGKLPDRSAGKYLSAPGKFFGACERQNQDAVHRRTM